MADSKWKTPFEFVKTSDEDEIIDLTRVVKTGRPPVAKDTGSLAADPPLENGGGADDLDDETDLARLVAEVVGNGEDAQPDSVVVPIHKLEEVVEKIIEKGYSHKIEAMVMDRVEKTLNREIEKMNAVIRQIARENESKE